MIAAPVRLGLMLMSCAVCWCGVEAALAGPPAAAQPLPTKADVAYGTDALQVLDFWQAESAQPAPLVFFMHGGGWVQGDKRPVRGLTNFLAAGLSVVSIEYRRVAQAQAAGVRPPVEWPMRDAARALQFVRSKAKEWNIDPARIGVSGGSAGACSTLWLALHDDLAEPQSTDPVARQSTRVACAALIGAQTTLDPRQMKEWIPNSSYGAHAFGISGGPSNRPSSFQRFLDERERVLPWIKAYSPYEWASADDPPVFMQYDDSPALGQRQKNATHSANFGLKLQERLREVGVACELVYPGVTNAPHATTVVYLIAALAPQGPQK